MPCLLLILWQFASSWRLVDPTFLPAPSAVVNAWIHWTLGKRSALSWNSGTWLEYVYLSTWRVLVGFAIAAVAGTVLGITIGWSRIFADFADPMVQLLRPIPMTAWLPFAAFIFGIHEGAAIFLIAMGAFFPIVVSCSTGAQHTPKSLLRAALMLGTPRRMLLLRVVLPSALPYVFTGFRLGIGLSWVLVIVAEMLAVKGGIGYAMWAAYQYMEVDLIIVAMLTVGMLGLATDYAIVCVARRLLRWNTGLTVQ